MHTNLILLFKPALYCSTLVIKLFKSSIKLQNFYCNTTGQSSFISSATRGERIHTRIPTSARKQHQETRCMPPLAGARWFKKNVIPLLCEAFCMHLLRCYICMYISSYIAYCIARMHLLSIHVCLYLQINPIR